MRSLDYRIGMEYLGRGEWHTAGSSLFHASRVEDLPPEETAELADASVVCFAMYRRGTTMQKIWDDQVRNFFLEHRKPHLSQRYDELVSDPAALDAAKARIYALFKITEKR